MKYQSIVPAEFVERVNRFIAYVKLQGDTVQSDTIKVHVKNTGRCKELLLPGAKVWLEQSDKPERATAYDLVAVEKGHRIVNIDSQATNKAVGEWLVTGQLFPNLLLMRPETCYGSSRFDFYVETAEDKIFLEVKGVTLEKDGVVSFPDAPSERAVKHVEELIRARSEGYRACVLFVIQMKGVDCFVPAWEIHAEFAKTLEKASEMGVEIYAYDCHVTRDSMEIADRVPVYFRQSTEIANNVKEINKTQERNKAYEGNKVVHQERVDMQPYTVENSGLKGIVQPLLMWYDANRRVLPWRGSPDAYHVWVSEIMLQQTRVEAVKPYYERFMKALPDVQALAGAQEETLLKLWEGLGYYNRVRNLQKAAIQVMEDHRGTIPSHYGELLALCGIGSYTAGAIASIAYGEAVPAVDGNVLRVLSRLRKDSRLISDAKVKKQIERELEQIMPADRPGDFNQAMMELGACVCIPHGAPLCQGCPLVQLCEAHRSGEELHYPVKPQHKERKVEYKTILIVRDGERVVIRKRPNSGLLAGMYEFPSLDGRWTAEEVLIYLRERGLKTIRIVAEEDAKHIFTHKEWHMKGYLIWIDEWESIQTNAQTGDWIYIRPEETKDKYPIPSAFAAYTKLLQIKLGKENF
ncbi:MAG: A/G-specific adenine glycosylase [Lachnospiraceae bacterium]|nr:A/G-specific adenine glycosylase [Lachnospiraceae bacterium]